MQQLLAENKDLKERGKHFSRRQLLQGVSASFQQATGLGGGISPAQTPSMLTFMYLQFILEHFLLL